MLKVSASIALAACSAIVTAVDAGPSPATLVVYSGQEPEDVSTAITGQTTLVTFTLPDPAFGAPSDEPLAAVAEVDTGDVEQVQASADGAATFFRIKDGSGNDVIQGSISEVGGGGDLELSSVNVVSGVDVIMVSLSISYPK